MKKFYLLLLLVITSSSLFADELKPLLASGNKVYVEVVDVKDNIEDEYNYFVKHLNDKEEWGKWKIVDSKEAADFICKLIVEKKGSSIMSYGARVFAYIEILDLSGKSIWVSEQHKGNSNEFTGFNAHGDAMRKIVRKAIKEELYNEEI